MEALLKPYKEYDYEHMGAGGKVFNSNGNNKHGITLVQHRALNLETLNGNKIRKIKSHNESWVGKRKASSASKDAMEASS